MSERIRPDKIWQIPILDGELNLSPSYDHLHRWRHLGFSLLKYWDAGRNVMCDIALGDDGGDYIEREVGLFAIERTFFYESEHEKYVDYQSTLLEDEYGEELDDTDGEVL